MRPIVTDEAVWAVGLSVYHDRAKTVEPTKMPFRIWTPVDQRKRVLDGGK